MPNGAPEALHSIARELKKLSKVLDKTLNVFQLETWADEESLSENCADKNLDESLGLIEKRLSEVVKNVQTERRKL